MNMMKRLVPLPGNMYTLTPTFYLSVNSSVATHKPRTFPVVDSFEDEEIKGRSSLHRENSVSFTGIPTGSRSPAENEEGQEELSQGSKTDTTSMIDQSTAVTELATETITKKLFKLSTSFR